MEMYLVKIKEKLNEHVLTHKLAGKHMSKNEIISFLKLNDPDIEWFEIYEINENGENVKL